MAEGSKTGGRQNGSPNKVSGGWPTAYKPDYARLAAKLCELVGATYKALEPTRKRHVV